MANTFDPTFNPSSATLSAGNLTATSTTNGTHQNIRTVAGFTAGKVYWEITHNVVIGSGGGGVGIENASNGTGFLGATLYGFCYVATNTVYNNFSIIATWVACVANDVISVAVDIANQKLWLRRNAGNWNNTAGNDPATNVGGFNLNTLLTNNGTVYPAINVFNLGDKLTANFGSAAFAQAIPSGFVALDGGGGAGATQARAMVLA